MIDWRVAGAVGAAVAGEGPAATAPGERAAALAGEAAERVTATTGLRPDRPLPAPEAVDRQAWLQANLEGVRATLGPVAERLGPAGSGPLAGPARAAGGLLLGAEVGLLLGLFAQRVLGQYELVLLDPARGERLLLVAPNLGEAAEQMQVPREDLEAWVLVHEVTHAVQFTAVPWLREHLGSLLRQLLGTLEVRVEPGALMRLPGTDDVRALVEAVRQGGLVRAVAGEERGALLDRVQATMALVEGHAEHVMDAATGDLVADVPRLRAALARRRSERSPPGRLLERLLGLDLKLRQYEIGKRFCDAVVSTAGMERLNRAWERPEHLPSLDELERPGRWLDRVV